MPKKTTKRQSTFAIPCDAICIGWNLFAYCKCIMPRFMLWQSVLLFEVQNFKICKGNPNFGTFHWISVILITGTRKNARHLYSRIGILCWLPISHWNGRVQHSNEERRYMLMLLHRQRHWIQSCPGHRSLCVQNAQWQWRRRRNNQNVISDVIVF